MIVLLGSAVPLTVLPLLGFSTGVAGGSASTVMLVAPLVLPEASVAVALTTLPSGSGVASGNDQLPLLSTGA